MPSLDNLKKQAKLVLRWHRQGYYPVAARIRSVLPRFRHLTDAEVLAYGFKLSDAQELIARQSGFESWSALKQGIEDMTDRIPSDSHDVILAAEPQLFVSNIQASCDFYGGRLGFETAFIYGEPPFYAQVFRGGARLNLRHVDRPPFDSRQRERDDLLSATITLESVAGIKALFVEFQAAAAPFHRTLRLEPWGARTFIVKDPDGNLLLFAGPTEEIA